jgi:hypothetical protein
LPRSFDVTTKEAIGGVFCLTWSIEKAGGRPLGNIQS